MRTTLRLGVILASFLVAACGDNKDATTADAPVAYDSPPGTPDATEEFDAEVADAGPTFDAPPGFECNGVAIPTTAETELTISGDVGELTTSGTTTMLAGVTVEAYVTGVATPVASDVSADDGTYSLTIANPDATPADGYLRTDSGGTRKINYLYPPTLIYTDIPSAPVRTLTQTTFSLLNALLGSPQEVQNGVIAVVVTNCNGEPVEGATVSSPQSTVVRYNSASGLPSNTATATAADGVAYVFNIAPGDATVDAEYNGIDFREHTVVVYSIGDGEEDNSITTTTIIP